MKNIVYFELNNWASGRDYPDDEPFIAWMSNDLNIKFKDEEWIKENKLCIVADLVDMSTNFCITTTKEWVEQNCPELLTKYREFLRGPDEDGCVYGRFGHKFLEYEEGNVGIKWYDLNL